MKKNIALLLSVLAVIISVTSILISVSTMKEVKKTTAKSNDTVYIPEPVDSNPEDVVDESNETLINEELNEIEDEPIQEENTDQTEEIVEESEENIEETVEEQAPAFYLSSEERQARLEQQKKIQEAREFLYSEKKSLENSTKINMYDKMMIDNNTVDFSKIDISIMGDSISAGVGSTPDSNGELKSYVGYLTDTFRFNKCYNFSIGGWCYSDVAGEEMAISCNLDTKMNASCDVFVFFAGVNDYLANVNDKRFGTYSPYDKSTAGYCASFEKVCDFMSNYLSDREVFVVLTYPVTATAGGKYVNETESHTWRDYVEAQRVIATRHGFHIIDLYSTGLIDGSVPEIAGSYLYDTVHPNDNGYRVLGDHIAAEISYVLGQE